MTKNLGCGDIEIRLPETIKENLLLPDPALLQIYRDRQNRVIWILGEIDEAAYDWVDFILDVNREDEEAGVPVEARRPIKLLIANRGGSSEVANTLVDIISISKTPVWGIAIGMCASAASMIYLACHNRLALPSTTFIFHQGSCSNLGGNYQELKAFMDDYETDIKRLTEFYKSHTTYAPEFIEENVSKGDWYIRVSEALENGIVNQVVTNVNELL